MKWQGRRKSSNVKKGGSGKGGMAISGGGAIVLLIIYLLFGKLPADIGPVDPAPAEESQPSQNQEVFIDPKDQEGQVIYEQYANERDLEDFLSVVLADTETYWGEIFSQYGRTYKEPSLYLYSDTTNTGCGMASSNVGPFYCPSDEGIYIDLSFYKDLKANYGAEGDFALAYVLAHEVGHHVQKQLGVLDQVYDLQGQMSEEDFNKYLVRLELQADYLAGVFAHYTQENGYLEEGDFQEAMNAAAGVGDDRIQEKAWGRVIPDKFTHGTSQQRMTWFNRGYEYGDLDHGDTFSGEI
ncbi:MAG: neutral zinc metallopeptidase [Bacillota bacterium]|nr:neutral zinc metallopeptidase [Bacillota bacterium]